MGVLKETPKLSCRDRKERFAFDIWSVLMKAVLIAPLPDLEDSDRLAPTLLEQLCRRLEIPPHIFY
jgi:hypothetical protein